MSGVCGLHTGHRQVPNGAAHAPFGRVTESFRLNLTGVRRRGNNGPFEPRPARARTVKRMYAKCAGLFRQHGQIVGIKRLPVPR